MRNRSSSFVITGGIACLLILLAVGVGVIRSSRDPQIAAVAENLDTIRAFLGSFSNVESFEGPEDVAADSIIYDEDGKSVRLADFKGKLVVLNFWATWCAPCIAELDSLAALKNKRDDIEVIAVSKDLRQSPAEIAQFLEKNKAGALDVYMNQGIELDQQFPTRGLPTTYIISPKGKIIYKMEGDTDWSSESALTFIDFAVKQN